MEYYHQCWIVNLKSQNAERKLFVVLLPNMENMMNTNNSDQSWKGKYLSFDVKRYIKIIALWIIDYFWKLFKATKHMFEYWI